MNKMYCLLCGGELASIPIYNNGEDEKYAPSLLFCGNAECGRFSLLTTAFSSKKPEKKDEGKKVKKN